ncbi:MAG: hypothetical protein RMH75_07210 [Archaeoglobaceae archaeon]|nr:hypothetical protein [Archaeoglobaceae archaeon]
MNIDYLVSRDLHEKKEEKHKTQDVETINIDYLVSRELTEEEKKVIEEFYKSSSSVSYLHEKKEVEREIIPTEREGPTAIERELIYSHQRPLHEKIIHTIGIAFWGDKTYVTAPEKLEKIREGKISETLKEFAASGGFLGGLAGIAIGTYELGKKVAKGDVVGAVKDVVHGTVEFFTTLPKRLTSGSPSQIGAVAGEIAGMYALGKGVSKVAKIPGKIHETVEFLGKEKVPIEKLTQPEVLQQKLTFPAVREIKGGEYGRIVSPEEAVPKTIEMFYKDPAQLTTEIGIQHRIEGKPSGFHATPEKLGKEVVVKGPEKRPLDVAGLYVSPDVSTYFLRLEKATTLNPIEYIKSLTPKALKQQFIEFFGFDRPTIAHIGLEAVERVPEAYRKSIEGMKEFFREGVSRGEVSKGVAYIEPKTEIFKTTMEAQAVIPRGIVLRQVRFEKYTEFKGKKIRIVEYKPEFKPFEFNKPFEFKTAKKAQKLSDEYFYRKRLDSVPFYPSSKKLSLNYPKLSLNYPKLSLNYPRSSHLKSFSLASQAFVSLAANSLITKSPSLKTSNVLKSIKSLANNLAAAPAFSVNLSVLSSPASFKTAKAANFFFEKKKRGKRGEKLIMEKGFKINPIGDLL